MPERNIFASLRGGGRVWAVGAIHGEAGRLRTLHKALAPVFASGDQLVYLGNYFGRGALVREAIDEMLLFRRAVLARPGGEDGDVTFLRGGQEEMWQKLLQLQFATNPGEVLQWMIEQGVGATIEAYGGSIKEAFTSAREGILSLTRWTSGMRQAMRDHDGHAALISALRHAAFTEDNVILFVHAGLDPGRPLEAQSDSFWWGGSGWAAITEPYGGFARVVRGFDRRQGGRDLDGLAVTLDSGCGFGGPLTAGCFDAAGRLLTLIEA